MTEQTGEAEVQGTEAEKVQGTPQEPEAGAQGAAAEDGEETVETLRAKIALLEKDNLSYRERERKREREEAKKVAAESSETERLASRVADLERQLTERVQREQEQSLRLASITSAQKLGYRNPDLAYRLLDTAAVEFGDDGAPVNVDAMLSALAKSDPYLLTHTDFGGGQRGASAAKGQDMNALIRSAAGRQP